MIRSMFTAINSMQLNQQYLDVVADNLSNVNTPGFKSSYVRFKDQFAQSISVGGAPSTDLGGINPMQVGLGTSLGTIGKSFSQGALTSTGNDLDMAISGDGFFIYNNGTTDLYSRDGSLAIDSDGVLVHSSSGDRIQGWSLEADGLIHTGSPIDQIQLPINDTVARATSEANILGNLDSGNAIPTTTTIVTLSGTLDSAVNSATISFDVQDLDMATRTVTVGLTRSGTTNTWNWTASAGANGTGTVTFDDATGRFSANTGNITVGGSPVTVNWQNVSQPLGTDRVANNISAIHDGTIAGSYDVTMGVYDVLGDLQSVTLRFTRTGDNDWIFTVPSTDTSGSTLVDASGDPLTQGTISFTKDGQYESSTGRVSVPASDGALTPTLVDLDLTGMTMLATTNSIALASQDGLAAGSLMGFTVSSNTGEIYGAYSNGDQRLIGQLALATFVNSAGLIRQGGNNYAAALNSGEPNVGAPGSGGHGTVASGYVEGSNVDMSREFSNMILAQRGFQASSRIINASDEILQELVNLGR